MKQESINTTVAQRLTDEAALPVHDAELLTDGKRKAIILLRDIPYTLHITKQGKLLLTK
ncbi:MAG: hemin uptake protein HemP [Pseudomonadota bacterium]